MPPIVFGSLVKKVRPGAGRTHRPLANPEIGGYRARYSCSFLGSCAHLDPIRVRRAYRRSEYVHGIGCQPSEVCQSDANSC